MLNFLIFSYLRAFKISCSTQLSMKRFITSGPGDRLHRKWLFTWLLLMMSSVVSNFVCVCMYFRECLVWNLRLNRVSS